MSRERAALGFAVFVSGGVLLGVEIAASRVLAPWFGNSLYVWGALIGVVLTGLSLGYWLGGALADRRPSLDLLIVAITAGALLVLAVPVADDDVLEAITRWDPGPRLNPLLAATILFGPLSVVLGTVTPIAVRIHARSLDSVGRTAGRLFAISTLGSIAGVFATAFVLIPELGTNELLALGAAALFAAVAVLAAGAKRILVAVVALALLAGSVVASRSLAPGNRLSAAQAQNYSPVFRLRGDPTEGKVDFGGEGVTVRFRKETAYHSLAVVDGDEDRYLRFDSSFQSGMKIADPFATLFEYTDYFHLALAYDNDARDVLFVGLGGASGPKRLWRDYPQLRIQVAELDPVVVDVARRWFALPRDRRLQVAVADGRRYLARDERRWDVIVLDAYYADSIPFHLTTREFLELVRSRLEPGGVVLTNVIGAITGPNSKLFRSFVRTYRSAFSTVLVHPVSWPPDSVQNLILVAGDFAAPSRDTLLERWRRVRPPTAPKLEHAIRTRYERTIDTSDVPLLTDDYAPTDALIITG